MLLEEFNHFNVLSAMAKLAERFLSRRTMKFLKDNRGVESTEVALIIAVVVLVAYGAYRLLGQNIAAIVTDIAGKI